MSNKNGVILHKDNYKVVIQTIIDKTLIRPGQIWRDSIGSPVVVTRTEWFDGELCIYYRPKYDTDGLVHDKDSFSFQCRYCLDPEGPAISQELQARLDALPVVGKLDDGI